jgi:hypothetical protein
MFGLNLLGPLGMATIGDGRPDNSPGDLSALIKAYAEARAKKTFASRFPAPAPVPPAPMPGGAYPNERVVQGFNALGPTPLQTAEATPAPLPSPALSAMNQAAPAPAPAVPTPQPRPDVPAPDPMGFFQRNAALMRDPSSGAFIDPTSAERAQASGPDVINKLLQMFHQKDMT